MDGNLTRKEYLKSIMVMIIQSAFYRIVTIIWHNPFVLIRIIRSVYRWHAASSIYVVDVHFNGT